MGFACTTSNDWLLNAAQQQSVLEQRLGVESAAKLLA